MLFAINAAAPGSGPAFLLDVLVLYGLTRLQSSRAVSCVTAVTAVYALLLSYGIINALESLLFPYILEQQAVAACVITAELLQLCASGGCYALLLRFFSLKEDGGRAWMLLPLCLFLPLSQFFILEYNYGDGITLSLAPEPGRHLTLLVLQALSLAALFSTLYVWKRACRSFEAQTALAALQQEARAQKIYVAEAQARYAQTRAFRHDIRNHLTVLAGLLQTGDTGEAQDYLSRLTEVAADLTPPVQTGCPAVDVLLGEKLAMAESLGIQTEISLALPTPCGVESLDWCILFANALDNALHACTRAGGQGDILRVTGRRQGDFYLLEFENTCLDEPLPPPGTGLQNIRAAAEKYHGTMSVEAGDGVFRLHVLLDIS